MNTRRETDGLEIGQNAAPTPESHKHDTNGTKKAHRVVSEFGRRRLDVMSLLLVFYVWAVTAGSAVDWRIEQNTHFNIITSNIEIYTRKNVYYLMF